MDTMRAGFGARFGAFVLDCFFVVIIGAAVMAVVGVIGGVRLGLDIQRSFGIPVTVSSLTNGEAWEAIGSRAEEVGRSIESRLETDFTPEQSQFIGTTIGAVFADYFTPKRGDIGNYIHLNGDTAANLVRSGFDAVRASGRTDIDPAKLTAAENEVMSAVNEFHLSEIIPRVVAFAIALVLAPFAAALIYSLFEAFSGTTPGKRLTRLRITTADGSSASAGMLFSRYLVKNAWLLLVLAGVAARSPALVGVAALAAVVSVVGSFVTIGPERRALHDYLAGTAVYFR